MKKYNFNAGPCVLPRPAVESAIEAIRDFDNTGIGILEISHRTPGWERIMKETADLWKELLHIPDNYRVLFLGGGASMQFLNVPANLLNTKAAYLQTGVWAKKAIKEAKFYGAVEVVASSEDKNYSYIPKGYSIPTDADYFHITTNNTIYGTELHEDIDSPVTLVADMSSDIMSRPVDVSKYGIIYGGAQKNVGPAGVAFVIVREDILGKLDPPVADHGGLSHPYWRCGEESLHVQHATRLLHLCDARDPQMGEGAGRCGSDAEAQQRKSSNALRRD